MELNNLSMTEPIAIYEKSQSVVCDRVILVIKKICTGYYHH